MKTLYKLVIVGVVVVFGLTGCWATIFAPFLGGAAGDGDQTTETALIGTTNTAESSSNPDGAPFNFGTATATVSPAAGQTITVTFNNGTVDLDATAGTTIPGLTIYELLATAATTGEYDRGSTVSYTATVVSDASGNSTAYLSVDLSGATVSNPIEIAMDPALVTGNGGAKLLNEDGDDMPAETGEDAAFAYVTVTAAPVAATGDQRNPRNGVNFFLPGAPAATDTTLLITGINTGGAYPDRFTATSLGGFSLFQFTPSTMTWAEVSTPTITYDGAGTLTLTLPAAVVAGDIFQIREDRYNIMTSSAAYGFIQHDTTLQNSSGARYQRSDLLVESGSFVAGLSSSADNGATPPIYVELTFSGVGDIVTTGITADNVRFIYMPSGGDPVAVPWDFFVVQDGTDGGNVLRFYFAPTFDPASGDGWEVYVYPTVTDDNGTPTDATDDIPVLDITEQQNGVSSDSGTFF